MRRLRRKPLSVKAAIRDRVNIDLTAARASKLTSVSLATSIFRVRAGQLGTCVQRGN